MKRPSIVQSLWLLIAVSVLIRGLLAAFLELGNDEVYYWTYALYPDWSHFDHPPMVGYFIQLFSLNLLFDHEFFLRISSVIFGGFNTWIIFLIGEKIKDTLTGWYAALLYNTSIYCFIIAGVFVLPDTPQLLFWLLSLYLIVDVFPEVPATRSDKLKVLLTGVLIGLGMLSKYTSVFLWIGIIAYIILFNRHWFRIKVFYLSILISAIVFLPVIFWNINNDFISFAFQGERVDFTRSVLQLDSFLRELSGQVFYNNPVNFVLIVIAIVALIRKKIFVGKNAKHILLITSLPLILIFLIFSLFRSTLPHWSGPGYVGLILLTSAYLSEKFKSGKLLFPWPIRISLGFLVIILILGVAQINGGMLFHSGEKEITKLGKKDITLDMYGWRQLGEKFSETYNRDLHQGLSDSSFVIISHRWFPAANLDYYVARPLDINVMAIGNLDRIHKYAWINEYRGGMKRGANAYFITRSHDYKDPHHHWDQYFEEIIPADTIKIYRGGRLVEYAFIYRLNNFSGLPTL